MSSPRRYIPARGDLIWMEFDPASGHEQMGKRPGLVLSEHAFNKVVGLALVAPITSRVRGHGFEVAVEGTKRITGVVLCQQIKMIDYSALGAKRAEKAPIEVVSESLRKVRAIVA